MIHPLDIKAVRKELDLTQAGLAEKIGTDQSTVSTWEQGHHKPGKMARNAIERLLREHREAVSA